MNKLQQCEVCGGMYPDEMMPDWTRCVNCKHRMLEEELGEPVYIDGLGIAWTQKDLEEAGGRAEVDRLVEEARHH